MRGQSARNARARAGWVLGAALLGLCACGKPENSLVGSVDELASLQFDSVVVRADGDVLVIEYDRHPNGLVSDGGVAGGTDGFDVAFKMTVLINGLTLSQGLDIDLTSHLADGTARVACSRSQTDDPRRAFPPIKRGDLVLDSSVNYDQVAVGHFDILFDEGGDVGEGRTVTGTFSAAVQNANPGSSS